MNTKSVAVLSVGINLGLILAITYFVRERYVHRQATDLVSTTSPNAPIVDRARKSAIVTIISKTNVFNWRVVESQDYREYISNLRTIGCPEETVRDIIKADVEKLFASRQQTNADRKEKFKFWKTGRTAMLPDVFNEERVLKQQQIAEDKRALLKELLGIDVEEVPTSMFDEAKIYTE